MKRVVAVLTVAVLLVFSKNPSGAAEKIKNEIQVSCVPAPSETLYFQFCNRFRGLLVELTAKMRKGVLEALSKEWEIRPSMATDTTVGKLIPDITVFGKSNVRGEMYIWTVQRSAQGDIEAAARKAAEITIQSLLEKPKKGRR